MTSSLALFGGTPVISPALGPYKAFGPAEIAAATRVIESGSLSGFFGSHRPEFFGGPEVKAFEAMFAERFGVKHAVSVNSATSGLEAAVAAIGLTPGDEVIVPPWTMSATVMAVLAYGGIPVFADIDPDTHNIDPDKAEAAITPKTRALLVVNLMGQPVHLKRLRALADAKGITLIEDNAQGPLAEEFGRLCGTIGHIGVFSLNRHKHIQTGEGGVCLTDDDDLALRMKMVRNHGENVAGPFEMDDITNMVGHNWRLSELHAALAIEQMRNIDVHVARRETLAKALSARVRGLNGITAPYQRPDCRHVYYAWGFKYDAEAIGPSRAAFAKACAAEGFNCYPAYLRPLYMLPVFQKRRAIGRDGWPFTLTERTYQPGLCPIAEELGAKRMMIFEPCSVAIDGDPADLADRFGACIEKVLANAGLLAAREKAGELP